MSFLTLKNSGKKPTKSDFIITTLKLATLL